MLGRGTKPDPFITEKCLDTTRDHRLEYVAGRFIAHAVQQFSTRTHGLQCTEVPTLVMYARQTVTDKLFRDVCEPIPIALLPFIWCQRSSRADSFDSGSCEIGDPAAQLSSRIPVVSAAGRIRGVPRDTRHLESFSVVVRGVAAP